MVITKNYFKQNSISSCLFIALWLSKWVLYFLSPNESVAKDGIENVPIKNSTKYESWFNKARTENMYMKKNKLLSYNNKNCS